MIWWTWEEIWVKRYVDRDGYESEYEDTIADLSNDLGSIQRHRGLADDHDIRSIFVFDAWRLISLSTSPRDFEFERSDVLSLVGVRLRFTSSAEVHCITAFT